MARPNPRAQQVWGPDAPEAHTAHAGRDGYQDRTGKPRVPLSQPKPGQSVRAWIATLALEHVPHAVSRLRTLTECGDYKVERGASTDLIEIACEAPAPDSSTEPDVEHTGVKLVVIDSAKADELLSQRRMAERGSR